MDYLGSDEVACSISLLPQGGHTPCWYLRRGDTQRAADTVNQIIRRGGDRVPQLTVEALDDGLQAIRE